MSIIAKVNGEILTSEMVDNLIARFIFQINEYGLEYDINDENYKFLKTEMLSELIDRTLLLQHASQLKIQITDKEVYDQINTIKNNYSSLDEWNNDMKRLNINEEILFDEIRKDLIIDKLIDYYCSDIEFNDDYIKNFYNENKSIIREPDTFTFYYIETQNSEDVKLIYKILKENNDQNILNYKIKEINYELEYYKDIKSTDLSEEYLKVLSNLEIGQIGTMPVDDNYIALLKIEKKTLGKELLFEEVKEDLREYLINSLHKTTYSMIKEKEFENAKIEYYDINYLKKNK